MCVAGQAEVGPESAAHQRGRDQATEIGSQSGGQRGRDQSTESGRGPLAFAVTKADHGTSAGWHSVCRCTLCRRAHAGTQRTFGRARAQQRLPLERRQRLLDGIYAGRPFRTVVRDLGLTPNQVWGLTKTDEGWSTALEAALTASRRVDLQRGTNAAYVAGCVCGECRSHQRVRMAKQRN